MKPAANFSSSRHPTHDEHSYGQHRYRCTPAQFRRGAPPCPHSKIIAVLKANAYGHGLLPVAHALAQADAYAVARVEEALVLRANAITKPILVLGGFFSAEALPLLAKHELQTTLHTWEQLALLEQASLPAPSRYGSSSIPG